MRHLIALAKLYACRVNMDGFAAVGNRMALQDYAAREARLLAELRPLGTSPEPRDDDDEDGQDDDLKGAAHA